MTEKLLKFTLITLRLNLQLVMRKDTLTVISAHSLSGQVTTT